MHFCLYMYHHQQHCLLHSWQRTLSIWPAVLLLFSAYLDFFPQFLSWNRLPLCSCCLQNWYLDVVIPHLTLISKELQIVSVSIFEVQSWIPSVAHGIGKFTIEGLPGEAVCVHTEHMAKPGSSVLFRIACRLTIPQYLGTYTLGALSIHMMPRSFLR